MNCPQCGKQVPAGAAFCMHCGKALSAGQPQVPRPAPFVPLTPQPGVPQTGAPTAVLPSSNISDAFEQQKRKTTIIAVALACVAALCVAGFTLKSMGLLGANAGTPDDKALAAKGGTAGAPFKAAASVPDPPLAATAQNTEMPDDIYKWLEHLRKTEDKRLEITTSHLTTAYTEKEKSEVTGGVDALKDLLNGIDDPNSEIHSPTEKLGEVIKKMHDDCRDLQAFFDSVEPPAECIPIRDAYDQALTEEAGEMGDIADHLAAGDIDKLLKMEGKSAKGIDSAGEKTDRLVGEICDKYHKRRWFNIASDIKSSPLFGSGF